MSTLSTTQFDYVCQLIRNESAIVLESGKEYLVESRLAPIARREGLASVAELVQKLVSTPQVSLRSQVVDAMTTNETSFFRDVHPWQALREHILPDLFRLRAAQRRLNIWCAACSSGQEPYSLAMLLHDDFREQVDSWAIRIVATDISDTMVDRCRAGSFSQLEVNRGLPAASLMRHFTRHGMDWRINDSIKRLVDVRKANLVVPSTQPQMSGIDLVIVRNVLIYFDDATKATILNGIRPQLNRDGYLLLGSSEVTTGTASGFSRHQLGRTIYFKPTA